MKLNFDLLPAFVTSGTVVDTPQQYTLMVRHGFVLQDTSEYLTSTLANTASGRTQAAFPIGVGETAWEILAKKYLFNARIQPEFLSYEKAKDINVRIIKTQRVLGKTTSRLQSASGDSRNPTITPERHMTFNWSMPKMKQAVSPQLVGSGDTQYVFSKMWIPFVCVTLERSTADDDIATNLLQLSHRSHFTYTDT